MAERRGKFTVGAGDIAEGERIENHLKSLALAGTELVCTANPQASVFKVGAVSRADDRLQLISLKQFPPLRSDDIATFYYIAGHEPFRFGQRVISADPAQGLLLLHFPLIIRSNERRAARRFTFPRREEVHTTVISGLDDGVGVSGPLRDLGSGGGALLVEKMALIPSGKEIHIQRDSLRLGPVALIKFRLPGGLDVETGGRMIHSCPEEPAFRAGFQFGPLPPRTTASLKAFFDDKFR